MPLRIVYVSKLAPDMTGPDFDSIVAYSKAANKTRGVTGILSLEGDRICQILEGPTDVVSGLFERIRLDKRHEGVTEIDRQDIPLPHFAAWGMRRGRMIDVVTFAFAL